MATIIELAAAKVVNRIRKLEVCLKFEIEIQSIKDLRMSATSSYAVRVRIDNLEVKWKAKLK